MPRPRSNVQAWRAARLEKAREAAARETAQKLEQTEERLKRTSSEVRRLNDYRRPIQVPEDLFDHVKMYFARELGKGMAEIMLNRMGEDHLARFAVPAARMLADALVGHMAFTGILRDSVLPEIEFYVEECLDDDTLELTMGIEGTVVRKLDRKAIKMSRSPMKTLAW
jgi:hypothetical protein